MPEKTNQYLLMDPLELTDVLIPLVQCELPAHVETKENQILAAQIINKATAYASYFSTMEIKAKLLKRNAKAEKNKDEFDRLLGVEEVFKTYKEIAKMQIENVARLMTLRRLDLDEQKNNKYIT